MGAGSFFIKSSHRCWPISTGQITQQKHKRQFIKKKKKKKNNYHHNMWHPLYHQEQVCCSWAGHHLTNRRDTQTCFTWHHRITSMTPCWKKQHMNINNKGVSEGRHREAEFYLRSCVVWVSSVANNRGQLRTQSEGSFGSEDVAAITASPRCWVEGTGPHHQIHRELCLPG